MTHPFPAFATIWHGIDFFGEVWRRRAQHVSCPAILDHFADALGPLNIRALAERSGSVQAWFSSSLGFSALGVDADAAQAAYATGATLHFHDLRLDDCMRACAAFLNVDPGRLSVNLFATPAGGRVSRHFDANENFTFQLAGAKRWTIAPCTEFVAPPVNHVSGHPAPPRLEVARRGPPQDVFTETSEDLTPGSVLYVPRGCWHATEAIEDSLSVNLCYGRAMWADVLCEALYARLMNDPRWRATAHDYFAGPAAEAFDAGVRELSRELSREFSRAFPRFLDTERLA